MCKHTEGKIYEPLDADSVVPGGHKKNPERAKRLRDLYGHTYQKATGSYTVPGHDCAYVDARNALIPEAMRVARRETEAEKVRRSKLFDPNERAWSDAAQQQYESRAFLSAMTRLWDQRGTRH